MSTQQKDMRLPKFSSKALFGLKVLYSIFVIVYMSFVFPTQLSKILDYHKINKDYLRLSTEVQALAADFLSAKDIDTIVKNSGVSVLISTYTDTITGELKSYSGEDLAVGTYVIEYILEGKDITYLFSYLSDYELNYDSISVIEDGSIILRIFCS